MEALSTPLQTALRGYLLRGSGNLTFVLRSSDHHVDGCGFAQVRAHKTRLAWRITRMAPPLDSTEQAASVWYRLLLHVCLAAGEQQVQRLFARVGQESAAEEVFRQAGFAVYGHEHLFELLPAGTPGGRLSARAQPADGAQRWDAQRLYQRVTPRLVLQAEALNGACSDLAWWERSSADEGQTYTWYDAGGEIEGCLYVATESRGCWLRLLLRPDARECAAEIVGHAMAVVRDGPRRPIYWAVRDYDVGVRAPLEEYGFALVSTCSLLVKHTAVQVREAHRKLVPALEKRAGVAPTVSRSGRSVFSNE